MQNVTAILSMLHEPATPNSALRRFRQQPVLGWTLQRLAMSEHVQSMAVLCWEDQLEAVSQLAGERDAHVLSKNPRMRIASLDSITAARRWTTGWRGGLLATCDFDLGFYGPWVKEIVQNLSSEAVILVDPSAGLVDPKIIDRIIEHARSRPNLELCFTQAAPGLAGILLRPALIDRLASARTHPGKILHYLPDQPMRDPIGGDSCVPVATSIARTTHSFRLDSNRQIQRMTDAAIHLNGQLVASDAEDLLHRLKWTPEVDSYPREIVLELNTNRATSPIFWPGRFQKIDRAPMTLELARRIFDQLSQAEDIRLTLAGVGDPLLHPDVFEIVKNARSAGVRAIQIETDLLPANADAIARLVESGIDAVSVHLPAMTAATYMAVMDVDRLAQVMENIRQFVIHRQQLNHGVPILVPTFIKCQANLAEMETWYDQWLKAMNVAVITGPSDFSGSVPDCAVADMSPPRRSACSRLWSRMTILSDGKVATCEQDVLAKQVVGDANDQSLADIWQGGFASIRNDHKTGCWSTNATCAACREWHRP